ncbi:MAG: hypothetical protein ABIS01_07865, partial [Ferruginibacter sp.]
MSKIYSTVFSCLNLSSAHKTACNKTLKHLKFVGSTIAGIFLMSISLGQSISVTGVATTPVCAGSNVTIYFQTKSGNGAGNRFDNATLYTIYLSNSVGAGFTAQGAAFTVAFGYIGGNGGVTKGITKVFTIPPITAQGAGYKISIVSNSMPASVGAPGTGASPAFTIDATPTTASITTSLLN